MEETINLTNGKIVKERSRNKPDQNKTKPKT